MKKRTRPPPPQLYRVFYRVSRRTQLVEGYSGVGLKSFLLERHVGPRKSLSTRSRSRKNGRHFCGERLGVTKPFFDNREPCLAWKMVRLTKRNETRRRFFVSSSGLSFFFFTYLFSFQCFFPVPSRSSDAGDWKRDMLFPVHEIIRVCVGIRSFSALICVSFVVACLRFFRAGKTSRLL